MASPTAGSKATEPPLLIRKPPEKALSTTFSAASTSGWYSGVPFLFFIAKRCSIVELHLSSASGVFNRFQWRMIRGYSD